MNKKKKSKPRKTSVQQSGSELLAEAQLQRIRRIRRDFLVGMFLSVILITFKWSIESSQFCKQIEQMTSNLLQLRLLSLSNSEEVQLTVVDISDLPFIRVERGKGEERITPREPLSEIIEAIAEQHPKAIGIDINFSPDEFGYVLKEDPKFFEFCLNLRQTKHIPIYLGIYDSIVKGPEKWLGQPQFKDMAAYIAIPNPEETLPTTKLFEQIKPNNISKPCPSMAFALANSFREQAPALIGWAVNRADAKRTDIFSTSEFLIDFSPIEGLIRNRLRIVEARDILRHKNAIKNKLILIGRATPGQTIDQFVVPGRGQTVQGIYIHASAAYTLLQAPLYKLTHFGRIVADFLVCLVVFGSIAAIRWAYHRKMQSDVAAHRLYIILTGLVVIVVIFAGDILVQRIRLMWTDFLLVIGALLLHSPVAEFFGWSRRVFPRAWHGIILETEKSKKGKRL